MRARALAATVAAAAAMSSSYVHYARSGTLTEIILALISWRHKNGSYILLLPPNFPPRCRLRLRKNAHSSRGAEPPANDLHSENLLHRRSFYTATRKTIPPRSRTQEKVNATSAYATIFEIVCLMSLLLNEGFRTRLLSTEATELEENSSTLCSLGIYRISCHFFLT